MNRPFTILAFGIMAVIALMLQVTAFQFVPQFEPIFMSRSEMERSVAALPPREIENAGKLWVYDQYIFVIEQFRGIHVIDNSNPTEPMNLSFIHVDGCTDLAVSNGVIYTNNAVDLIAIKPSLDMQMIDVVSRNKNELPVLESPDPWNDWYYLQFIPDDHIIVRWRENR